MTSFRRAIRYGVLAVAIAVATAGAGATPEASQAFVAPSLLEHRGVKYAADGKLVTNLVLKSGESFSTTLRYPNAETLGVRRTWACWIFPEDAWAVGGNSEIELYVDGVRVTHFAVAEGQWKVLIQSLAEHITEHVTDPRLAYRLTLRNAGAREVRIRELWLRWFVER